MSDCLSLSEAWHHDLGLSGIDGFHRCHLLDQCLDIFIVGQAVEHDGGLGAFGRHAEQGFKSFQSGRAVRVVDQTWCHIRFDIGPE